MTLSNHELENVVLGCFLAWPEQSGPFLAENAKVEYFTGNNQDVFRALCGLFADGKQIDFMAAATALKEAGRLESIGGALRISDLMNQGCYPALLAQHVPELRDLSCRRRLHNLLAESLPAVSSDTDKVGDLLSRPMVEIEAIGNSRTTKTHPSTKELVMEAVKRIQTRFEGGEDASGVSTLIKRLDAATGGLRPGAQWVIAGPAKGGKSSLAICFLRSLAIKHEKRCAFYGMEMPSLENVERLLCSESNTSAEHLRDGMLAEQDFAKLAGSAARVASSPIHFRDDIFDITELCGNIRNLKSAHPDLFAVFVDYAQLVSVAESDNNREREVAIISRTLRKVGMQLNLCIILLSQVNDDGKLRESRALGMDATKIVFIDFNENPKVRTLRLVQRDGPADKFDVAYIGDRFQFADLAEDYEPEPIKPTKKPYRKYNDQ